MDVQTSEAEHETLLTVDTASARFVIDAEDSLIALELYRKIGFDEKAGYALSAMGQMTAKQARELATALTNVAAFIEQTYSED